MNNEATKEQTTTNYNPYNLIQRIEDEVMPAISGALALSKIVLYHDAVDIIDDEEVNAILNVAVQKLHDVNRALNEVIHGIYSV